MKQIYVVQREIYVFMNDILKRQRRLSVICFQSVDSKFVILLDAITRGYTDKTLISKLSVDDRPIEGTIFRQTSYLNLSIEYLSKIFRNSRVSNKNIQNTKKKEKREIKLSTLEQNESYKLYENVKREWSLVSYLETYPS